MSIDKRLISTGAAVCTTDALDIFGDSSCIALYGLNYDGSDAGGNYNGTSTDVTFNTPGYIDYAASFNGTSSEVEISSNVLNINTISISAWININTTSGYRQIVSNYASGNFGWGFRVENGGYLTYNTTVNAVSGSTVLSTNTWYHAVLTIDSAGNSSKIYLNGIEDGSGTYIAPSYSGNTNFHIGSLGNINVQYFSGKIDQVRIFNKALSAAEVTALYGEVACEYTCTTDTNGFPASASSNLVAYYKLDNDATDETGSYNGTASNLTFDGGRYGAAAYFNGTNSKIIYPTGYPFDQANSIIAVSAWVKLPSAGTEFVLLGASSTSDQNDHIALIVGGNKAGRIFIRDASGSDELQANFGSSNNTNWNHYVWQLSATNGIELWVNGVSQTRTVVVQTGGMTSNSWFGDIAYASGVNYHTGINRVVTTAYYTATVDQMRLFTNELSSSEVSTIYEDEHQCYITVDSTDPFGDGNNIALYKLENNANDSTGSYNGTASNVTYSTDSIIGTYAASFNGSSSTITSTLSGFTGNPVFSISFWLNPSAHSGTPITLGASTAGAAFVTFLTNQNKINFGRWGDSLGDTTASAPNNTWTHVAISNNAGTVKVYVNGIADLTFTTTYNIGNNNFYIGAAVTSQYFNGKIDQIRIFDRALNGNEAWKLYAEGAKG